ncbi:hypothetical protein SARC_08731 [Sphaeroforma arctica JP610]|uniref:Uncharacterized protein n=1 Tax=Sphaeroforma arctica JP610 TaxID=667725 RepID=A0A0L0FPX9_9EUKA|nr:hypothetical protein SARC_08731 [Sphaeroforma arctica JP610]KNC78857.1 hypothetical protein SARC_08731 [Sphaeroforma arctica JP610]|eukprot:XP_014152759.1 hypothetical protein SARC_08731 [Sphaeroforma arctica JP610]
MILQDTLGEAPGPDFKSADSHVLQSLTRWTSSIETSSLKSSIRPASTTATNTPSNCNIIDQTTTPSSVDIIVPTHTKRCISRTHDISCKNGKTFDIAALIASDSIFDKLSCDTSSADCNSTATTRTINADDSAKHDISSRSTAEYASLSADKNSECDDNQRDKLSTLFSSMPKLGQKIRYRTRKCNMKLTQLQNELSRNATKSLMGSDNSCGSTPDRDDMKTAEIPQRPEDDSQPTKVDSKMLQRPSVRRNSIHVDNTPTFFNSTAVRASLRRGSAPQVSANETIDSGSNFYLMSSPRSNLLQAISSLPDIEGNQNIELMGSNCGILDVRCIGWESPHREKIASTCEVDGTSTEDDWVFSMTARSDPAITASTQLRTQSAKDYSTPKKSSSTVAALRNLLPVFNGRRHSDRKSCENESDTLHESLRSCMKPKSNRVVISERVTITSTFSACTYDRSTVARPRLSRFEHMTLYKELMEYKINEMPVHFESLHLTNMHRLRGGGVGHEIMCEIVNSIMRRNTQ